MKKIFLYVAFGFVAWVLAEYVTVWAERGIAEWASYMPCIFVFYIVYPLLFAFLIYGYKWGNLRLFAATIAAGFVLEIVFFQNYALVQLPTATYYIPALILIYSFLTFAPKFAVSKVMALPPETIKWGFCAIGHVELYFAAIILVFGAFLKPLSAVTKVVPVSIALE